MPLSERATAAITPVEVLSPIATLNASPEPVAVVSTVAHISRALGYGLAAVTQQWGGTAVSVGTTDEAANHLAQARLDAAPLAGEFGPLMRSLVGGASLCVAEMVNMRDTLALTGDHGSLAGLADDDHPQYGPVTNPLSQFAATSSAQLAGVISDETGTGLLVFGTSPTIVTPTIASFAGAAHDHQDAAGGAQLDHGSALTGVTADQHHNKDHASRHEVGGADVVQTAICEVSATAPAVVAVGQFWYDTDAVGSSVSSTVNLVTKTANYTLTPDDVVVLGNGTFTLTLPTAVGIAGKMYRVKNTGTGVITVDGDGSETIDGGATAILAVRYAAITIISDNTEWWIL